MAKYNSRYSGPQIDDGIRPYKVYSAQLYQITTGAPTPTVYENTIGGIVWTRFAQGIFRGTLTGAFTLNKTMVMITSHQPPILLAANNPNITDMKTYLSNFSSANYVEISHAFFDAALGVPVLYDTLDRIHIDIRVYP